MRKRGVSETLETIQAAINSISQRVVAMDRRQTDMDQRQQEILELLKSHSKETISITEAADVHKSFQGIYRVPTIFTT